MRCTNLVDDERCPNKALRGKCYCEAHAPADTRRALLTQHAQDLLQTTEDNETMLAMKMLLAMVELETTNSDTIAQFLGAPRRAVRTIARRLRNNQIWIEGKLGIDEDVDLEDEQSLSVMFILFALCGSGKVVRT